MQSVRTVVRTLIAGFLAMAGPVLAAPAVLAHAQEVQQHSSGTVGASSHQLTVSIDAVSPGFATPTSTVTVRGTITNHTGSPVTGVQVQLLTTTQHFVIRSDMDSYAAGTNPNFFPFPVGNPYVVRATLRSGATARWSASFSAAPVGYSLSQIEVYPLEAQAEYADGTLADIDRTFLPFWPGKGAGQPLNTAWVWPLVDRPQQGPCQRALATNELAASLGTGGRLHALLTAGLLLGKRDHITWAVDPALLSDANVMTRAYKVDANSNCVGTHDEPASAAAAAWLSSLATEAGGDPMFVTPYADPDVAALTHAGLDSNLRSAFQLGESVGAHELSRSFGKNGESTGDKGAPAVAWPADGVADASVLTNLASNGGISTVVLNSKLMGAATALQDNALAVTTTETGKRMSVLLADSELTGILGSASAGSPASVQFAAEQDFLAQTAMIVAEAPYVQRSLVIAPPRRWDPSASEAVRLLSMTHSAPWLHKVDLGSLATAASSLEPHQPLAAHHVRTAELAAGFLDQVRSVNSGVATYKALLLRPKSALLRQFNAAEAVLVSAAWRGTNSNGGWQALTKLSDYLSYRENQVQILTGAKLLLAGASGSAPVSVQNGGTLPIQVKLRVSVPANSRLSVGGVDSAIPIPAKKIGAFRMTVNSSAIGTTQLQLQLVTKDGRPLNWTTKSMSVQATRYGRALLVLIGAALGVLVLTAVARWIRRLTGARA